MDFKNTIFVTDMDGTLLNKNKDITEKNISAINEYRANGGIRNSDGASYSHHQALP